MAIVTSMVTCTHLLIFGLTKVLVSKSKRVLKKNVAKGNNFELANTVFFNFLFF